MTPVAIGLGNDFSPPDSNEPSHAHQKQSDGFVGNSTTVITSPRCVNAGNRLSDNGTASKIPTNASW